MLRFKFEPKSATLAAGICVLRHRCVGLDGQRSDPLIFERDRARGSDHVDPLQNPRSKEDRELPCFVCRAADARHIDDSKPWADDNKRSLIIADS